MNLLLKMFSIDTLITFVISFLASTVKNPLSEKALQLRYIVFRLFKATRQFLEMTGGVPPEEL